MTTEMRQTLARLSYAEKLRRVAALIEFSKRFKVAKTSGTASGVAGGGSQDEAKPIDGATFTSLCFMTDMMKQLLARKVERRSQLAALPVGEKLRMLEEMVAAAKVISATHPPKPANPVRMRK